MPRAARAACNTLVTLALRRACAAEQAASGTPWRSDTHGSIANINKLNDELQEAFCLMTCPIWLDAEGTENVPFKLSHSTHCKPSDINPIKGGMPSSNGSEEPRETSLSVIVRPFLTRELNPPPQMGTCTSC